MTLLKMIGMGDDLPLKLGARLPRDYEKKANIAKMERAAKMHHDWVVANEPVKWVDGNEDAVQISDCRHPVAQAMLNEKPSDDCVIKQWFNEASGKVVVETIKPEATYAIGFDPAHGEDFTTITMREGDTIRYSARISEMNAQSAAMRAMVERMGFASPRGERVGPYTKVGENQYTWLDVNSDEEWTLTPPTDAEVRDFYKGRALGRGISTHESTLWAHRMDLRQHLRTNAKTMRRIADAEKLRDELCGVTDVMRSPSEPLIGQRRGSFVDGAYRTKFYCEKCGVAEGGKHFLHCGSR